MAHAAGQVATVPPPTAPAGALAQPARRCGLLCGRNPQSRASTCWPVSPGLPPPVVLQVLQDSLCGSSKVLLVCCVSPEADSAQESISSLNFASRAAQVRPCLC